MLGSDVPDLAKTPCTGCREPFRADSPDHDVVWDPYARTDVRVVALPYHRRCAGSILPPAEPTPAMSICDRCSQPIAPAMLEPALTALHERFETAKGSLASPHVVWRVAGRDPRAYAAEHFACLLKAVDRSTDR